MPLFLHRALFTNGYALKNCSKCLISRNFIQLGCTINWKEGKNLTVKTVKKKQKHKSKGNVRTITKQVKNDSFFNFFDPPPIPDDPDADIDPETQDLLTADFEIGHYIRDRIIPRAVLFFTGTF